MSASTNSWSRHRTTPRCGLERRERVVGDLGLGRADRGDQRRLARVGKADRARRRRAASARAAATAPRRTRPARRSSARAARSTGTRAFRALPDRPAPRASGRRGARDRRAARCRARTPPCLRARRRPGPCRRPRAASCPSRAVPEVALRWGWSRNARSDATLRLACNHTSPPRPPSPPSGPPRGTCDSRRNATQPAPPSPPFRLHCATSTKPDTPHRIRTVRVPAPGSPYDRGMRPRPASIAITVALLLLGACSSGSHHKTPPSTTATTPTEHLDDHEHVEHHLDHHHDATRGHHHEQPVHDADGAGAGSSRSPDRRHRCSASPPTRACNSTGRRSTRRRSPSRSMAVRCSPPTATAATASLEPFTCNGTTQTYLLTAYGANGTTAMRTIKPA